MKANSRLRMINIDITGKCDCSCIHCGQETKETQLTLEEITRIVKEGRSLGLTDVVISGGEPFLHPKFYNILDALYSERVYVSILTNGMSIGESEASYLSTFPNLAYVRVSIESADASLLDEFRKTNGSLERVLNALSCFRKYNVPYGTSMTVGIHNFEGVIDFIKLSLSTKAHFIRTAPYIKKKVIHQPNSKVKGVYETDVDPADLSLELLKAFSNHTEKLNTGFYPLDNEPEKFSSKFRSPCPAGRHSFYVTNTLQATFCPFFIHEDKIDLRKLSIEQAWSKLTYERNTGVLASNSSCLLSLNQNKDFLDLRLISKKIFEKANRLNKKKLRMVLSGVLARQVELNRIGLHPCWRSSPWFLFPLRY